MPEWIKLPKMISYALYAEDNKRLRTALRHLRKLKRRKVGYTEVLRWALDEAIARIPNTGKDKVNGTPQPQHDEEE